MEFCETYTLDLGVPQCKSNLEKILDRLGYVSNRQDGTLFSRGSLFGSITSFSPKKWKAKLEITYRPKERYSTEIFIRLKVNTTGQKVTPREVGMLSSELSAIAAGVMGDFCGLEKVESSERLITKSGWIGAVVFRIKGSE